MAKTQASPQFPPGQWVKVFTRLEELPPVARAQLQFREGWIDGTSNSSPMVAIAGMKGRNQGVRARVKIAPVVKDQLGGLVAVRSQVRPNGGGADYRLALHGMTATQGVAISYFDWAAKTGEGLVRHPPDITLKPGDVGELELVVIGNKLIGRFNGKLLPIVKDERLEQGEPALQTKHLMRDVEVINLDGLPEAEALKIAGVDENGHDLRAAEKRPVQTK